MLIKKLGHHRKFEDDSVTTAIMDHVREEHTNELLVKPVFENNQYKKHLTINLKCSLVV
jgi:hypothetical protein